MQTRAYWTTGPRRGEVLTEDLAAPGPGEVLVRTQFTGISRGTELLVHRHQVPDEVAEAMRAPHQAGALPGPVKYGYLNVGQVERGPSHLLGRSVFTLFPHQERFVVPASDVTVVPDGVPAARAVLAGTVETAVNAVWDAAPTIGDRVTVVGAGMVGLSVALLLRRFPLERLQVVDVDTSRADLVKGLGLDFRTPEEADGECDIAVHTSASEAGLATGLGLLAVEGTLLEMSWFGTTAPHVPLGLDFHARRLRIRASQVSRISPNRPTRTFADRMRVAMQTLEDPAFDALLAPAVDFVDLPQTIIGLDQGQGTTLCQLVRYPQE